MGWSGFLSEAVEELSPALKLSAKEAVDLILKQTGITEAIYREVQETQLRPFIVCSDRGLTDTPSIAKNSFKAFQDVLFHGIEAVRTDVRRIKSGELVLSSQNAIGLGDKSQNLSDLSWAQVSASPVSLSNGKTEKIMQFNKLLKLYRKQKAPPFLHIEMRGHYGMEKEPLWTSILHEIDGNRYEGLFELRSPSKGILNDLHHFHPRIPLGFSTTSTSSTVATMFDTAKEAGATAWCPESINLNTDLVKIAHNNQLEVHPAIEFLSSVRHLKTV